ncbi:hypothetical protein AM588_10000814 [Phytophthora nicotianae]|uniref:Uncharacterized protein n=1 Tax=Phytophthora nicotianae TaxID=4792 RepID=A0A0W8CLX8_PHYNI|nr:hypothetical protein AM588_10000814 [Phytophthora nicotianae]
MGLEELQPGNTLRAKATAVAAFSNFLKVLSPSKDLAPRAISSAPSVAGIEAA